MRLIKYAHACVRLESDAGVLVIDPGGFSEREAPGRRGRGAGHPRAPDHLDWSRVAERAQRPGLRCSPTPRWRRSWTRSRPTS